MQYAKVIDNKITRILASSKPLEGYMELSENHQFLKGDDVRFFSEVGKRLSPEEAEKKGLIELGKKKKPVWENGWTVKNDYTKEKYWRKETKQPVSFKVGEKPDEAMTDQEPVDEEAVWEKDGWIIPPDVTERREKEEAERDLEELDKASIRAMREILTAMMDGKEPPIDSKELLLQRESKVKIKREVLSATR